MPTIEREIDRFQGYLTRQGQKLTQERTALVREIFATHYHFEADELPRPVCFRTIGGIRPTSIS